MRRAWEHRQHRAGAFTARYYIDRLVYFERTANVTAAIRREKQIKGWSRRRKLELIAATNPAFKDLASDWPVPDP